VDSGAILVDGRDVRDITQDSLHRAVGIVQQDVFLFASTVGDNIRYGRPDATDAEVMEAAKRAEIFDDIDQMPQGFDTYVGERGVRLSGGQKQRIAIARMFLKNPAVLILDEATSALDSLTEAKVQAAFRALSQGRTTLTIAHRLSTIRDCDRIIVIQDGRIAETGSHEELLEKGGVYAGLYRMQES
jgi:ATP-binding cassette subfamily B protein